MKYIVTMVLFIHLFVVVLFCFLYFYFASCLSSKLLSSVVVVGFVLEPYNILSRCLNNK